MINGSVYNTRDFRRLEHWIVCEAWEHDSICTNDVTLRNDLIAFQILSYTPVTSQELIGMVWGQIDLINLIIFPKLRYPKSSSRGHPITFEVGRELNVYQDWTKARLKGTMRINSARVWQGSRATLFRSIKRWAKEAYLDHWKDWTPEVLKIHYEHSQYKKDAEDSEIHAEMVRWFNSQNSGPS